VHLRFCPQPTQQPSVHCLFVWVRVRTLQLNMLNCTEYKPRENAMCVCLYKQTHTNTDRQTDRQRHRQTHRQTDRQTDRNTVTHLASVDVR
jgi:hypothetical protein